MRTANILSHSKPRYLSFFLGWLILGSASTGSAAPDLPIEVTAALKHAAIPLSATGIYVQQVDSRHALLAANDNTPLSPASTMKLVVSDAALELLGPTFTWKTEAYADGAQNGEILQGNLIIKGSGDPKLVIENFWSFLRKIRAAGIRDIRGDLVLDRTAFESKPYDPSAFDGDPLKPYNAGTDALLLNYQALGFQFTPDLVHNRVNIAIDPPIADFPVGAPQLSQKNCDDWHTPLHATVGAERADFSGTFSALCGTKTWYVHPYLMTHTHYFGAVFRQIWRELGGTFSGTVKEGRATPDARPVAEWESVTLPEVIRDMNKFSNNVMARQLLLTLAAQQTDIPANPERGARVVQAWIADKGFDTSSLNIENGAGLSRTERISAGAMGHLLVNAFQSPLMPEFVSSLPLVGYDGTMRHRLTKRDVAGHAHIKTGTLDDVRAIAGYVLAASGKYYAVVCMINHPNAVRGQQAQDELLQWIYSHG